MRWQGTNGVRFQLLRNRRTFLEGGMTMVWKHSLGLFTTASKGRLLAASREGYADSVVWAAEGHLKNGSRDKHCVRDQGTGEQGMGHSSRPCNSAGDVPLLVCSVQYVCVRKSQEDASACLYPLHLSSLKKSLSLKLKFFI